MTGDSAMRFKVSREATIRSWLQRRSLRRVTTYQAVTSFLDIIIRPMRSGACKLKVEPVRRTVRWWTLPVTTIEMYRTRKRWMYLESVSISCYYILQKWNRTYNNYYYAYPVYYVITLRALITLVFIYLRLEGAYKRKTHDTWYMYTCKIILAGLQNPC